jgi:hypothetical protein
LNYSLLPEGSRPNRLFSVPAFVDDLCWVVMKNFSDSLLSGCGSR